MIHAKPRIVSGVFRALFFVLFRVVRVFSGFDVGPKFEYGNNKEVTRTTRNSAKRMKPGSRSGAKKEPPIRPLFSREVL